MEKRSAGVGYAQDLKLCFSCLLSTADKEALSKHLPETQEMRVRQAGRKGAATRFGAGSGCGQIRLLL